MNTTENTRSARLWSVGTYPHRVPLVSGGPTLATDAWRGRGGRIDVVHRVDIPLEASTLRKVTNWFEWTSSLPTVRLEVSDGSGTPLFTVVFSAESAQFTATVRDAAGNDLGQVARARGMRKIHFDLKAGDLTVGTVDATRWAGFDFRIDEGGVTVGRITTQGEDAVAGVPTTSHDSLLDLDRDLAEPLRTLVVACAGGMDVSVSQAD